jgi:hypothetical protein
MSASAVLSAADERSGMQEPTRGWMFANVALTQIGWFACVLGAAKGLPWLGTTVAVFVVGWHLWLAPQRRVEAKLLLAAMLLGSGFDAAMQATDSLAFVNGHWLAGLGPHWMTALWALFATNLNVVLRWLKGRWLLCVLLGAIAGPLSFVGGAKLGAATLVDPGLALGLLAAGWAVMLPLLVGLGMRWDGVAAR